MSLTPFTVTDAQAVESTIKQIHNDFGALDIFVANAGTGKAFKIAGSDVSDWHSLVDVVRSKHSRLYSRHQTDWSR